MEDNKRKYEDEIDFKKLLKNPKRLFGWIFPYFFLILLILGIFYVNNLNEISFNQQPINPPVEDNVKRILEMKKGVEMPPVNLDIIKNPTQEVINTGKTLYQQNCASCHGDNGEGDGPAGAALNPPPRNYKTADGWTNGRKFSDMYKTLQEGIVENGMAAYEYLPPVERISIIQYIRTFANFPEITDEEVQELNSTYNLTEGVKTSNQIPVDLAMKKLIQERSVTNKVYNVLDYVNNHPNLDGASVFNKVVKNRYRVLSAFYASNISQMNLEEFVDICTVNFNELGFKDNVGQLELSEWQSLLGYLKNVIGIVNS